MNYNFQEMKHEFSRDGYKILVHGGTGALGQAAIAIALNNNCEVFTTVSDIRKKNFLMKLFPELQGFQQILHKF